MDASKLHDLKEDVVMKIRAILGANAKDGLTENELMREYLIHNGRPIPFVQFGFHTLCDFLQDLQAKQIVWTNRIGMLITYRPILNNAHEQKLAQLVVGQLDRQVDERNRMRTRELQYQQRKQQQQQGLFGSGGTGVEQKQVNRFVPRHIQDHIIQVLMDTAEKSMVHGDFKRSFFKKHGYYFDASQYGFKDTCDLLSSLKHLLDVQNITADNFKISLKSDVNNNNNGNENGNGDQAGRQREATRSLLDEVIENLKKIVTASNTTGGIWVRDVRNAYKEMTKQDLPLDTLGYNVIIELIVDKLRDFVRIEEPIRNGDKLLFLKERRKSPLNDTTKAKVPAEAKQIMEANFQDLIKSIKSLFSEPAAAQMPVYATKLFTVGEFIGLLESKLKKKLTDVKQLHADYGLNTVKELIYKLNDSSIVKIKLSDSHDLLIRYGGAGSSGNGGGGGGTSGQQIKKPSSSQQQHQSTFRSEYGPKRIQTNVAAAATATHPQGHTAATTAAKDGRYVGTASVSAGIQYREKFLTETVSYYDRLEPYGVLFDFDLTKLHTVIVSTIVTPVDLYLQFGANTNKLDELMDELEKCYEGIGASHYDMPRQYVKNGKYCAAKFNTDQNWHRCQIVECLEDKKLARVLFIDYGGDEYVDINSLKFLKREFVTMPIQAINVRLANLQFNQGEVCERMEMTKNQLTKSLLQLVRSKKYECKFNGVIYNQLCVELNQKVTRPASMTFNLNEEIIEYGYAEEALDTADIDFRAIQPDVKSLFIPLYEIARQRQQLQQEQEEEGEDSDEETDDEDQDESEEEEDDEDEEDDEEGSNSVFMENCYGNEGRGGGGGGGDDEEDDDSSDEDSDVVYYSPNILNNQPSSSSSSIELDQKQEEIKPIENKTRHIDNDVVACDAAVKPIEPLQQAVVKPVEPIKKVEEPQVQPISQMEPIQQQIKRVESVQQPQSQLSHVANNTNPESVYKRQQPRNEPMTRQTMNGASGDSKVDVKARFAYNAETGREYLNYYKLTLLDEIDLLKNDKIQTKGISKETIDEVIREKENQVMLFESFINSL